VVERTQYEAFGQSSGSALTRYGFTGRERDNSTGLIYYRARWYDPQLG
jgi:RHS repeat-associated protein